jgi:hypothetical protein
VRDLVETVVKALAGHPEEISVTETEEDGMVSIDVAVAADDLGRIIGREGRTARALRSFVSAAGRKKNRRVAVRIKS